MSRTTTPTTGHHLIGTLEGLRRRVKVLGVAYGAGVVVAAAAGLLLATVLIDYLLNLPAVPRLAVILAALGGVGYLAYKWVVGPARARMTLGDVAGHLENTFPQFDDRLRSTVDFIRADYVPGSDPMKARTVADAERLAAGVNFGQAVVTRPVWYSAGGAVAALALLVALGAVLSPGYLSIIASRLFTPFSAKPWPKSVEIQMLRDLPTRVTAGSRLDVRMRLAKGHAKKATIFYRYDNGPWQSELMTAGTDAAAAAAAGNFASTIDAKLDAGKPAGRLEIKVAAGDDEHALGPVVIVPRLDVDAITARVTPPAYAGAPATTVNLTERSAVMPMGSNVELRIAFNKPLDKAQPVALAPAAAARPGQKIPDVTWDRSDPRVAVATFRADQSFGFGVRARDEDGFDNGSAAQEYQVVVRDDAMPSVQIEEPRRSEERTPNAEFTLRAVAEDDYGVAAAQLVVDRLTAPAGGPTTKPTTRPAAVNAPAGENHWVIDLVNGGAAVADAPVQWQPETENASAERKHFRLDYRWDLAKLAGNGAGGLKPGDVLEYYVQVRDNFSLDGQSHPWVPSGKLRLTIISQADWERALQDQIERIARELNEIKKGQNRNQGETKQLARDARDRGQFDQADRTAAERLAGQQATTASTTMQLAQKLQELVRRMNENKSPEGGLKRTAEEVGQKLAQTAQGEMNEAARSISEARDARPNAAQQRNAQQLGQQQDGRQNGQQQQPQQGENGQQQRQNQSGQQQNQNGQQQDRQNQDGQQQDRGAQQQSQSGQQQQNRDAQQQNSQSGQQQQRNPSGQQQNQSGQQNQSARQQSQSGQQQQQQSQSGQQNQSGQQSQQGQQQGQQNPQQQQQQQANAGDPQKQDAEQRAESLDRAAEQQEKAEQKLEQALGQLGDFSGISDFKNQVERIKDDQQRLNQDAAKNAKNNLGKTPEQMTESDRQRAEELAREQENLRQRTEQLLKNMQDKGQKQQRSNPSQSQAMQQAAQAGQQVPSQQQQNSQAMRQNQQSQAQDAQKKIELGLEMMLAKLRDAERRELEELARKLTELQGLIDELIRRQASHNIDNLSLQEGDRLAKLTEADRIDLFNKADREPDLAKQPPKPTHVELSASQKTTERNTRDVAKKAEALSDPAPAARLTGAAGHMERAIVLIEQTKLGEAYDPPQTEALRNLEEAFALVVEAQQQAQEQLRQQNQETVRQAYVKLLEDQKKLDGETKQIDAAGADRPRELAVRLGQLPTVQGDLSKRADDLGKQLEQLQSIVYAWANRDIIKSMNSVKDDLAKPETGVAVQAEQLRIEEQLQAMIDNLKQSPPKPERFANRQQGGGQGQGQQGQGQKRPPRMPGEAELRLLKGLQQAVNKSTKTIDGEVQKQPNGEKRDADKEKLLALGGRQGELRNVFDELIQKASQGQIKLGEEPDNKDQLPEEKAKTDDEVKQQLDDDDLVRELVGGNPEADTVEKKVVETGNRMARSRQRLAINNDPGRTTQIIQERIVFDLDNIIELAQRQQEQQQQQQQARGQRRQRQPRPGQPDQGQQQMAQNQPQQNGQQPAQNDNAGEDGPPRVDASGQLKEAMTEWGGITKRDRDAVMEGRNDQPIEKYRKLINDYYRSIAEKGRPNQ